LYDTDPNNFNAPVWAVYQGNSSITFDQYQNLLSQYALDCFPVPQSTQDRLYEFASKNFTFPTWVCGGVLYRDGWFSYSDCSYIAYDGSRWKVKNNACSDPNKVWQKIGTKCYATSWKHTIRFQDGSVVELTWNIPLPQNNFNQTQQFSVGGTTYKVNLKCANSTTVMDEVSGAQLVLCTSFSESVYGSQNSLLYQLSWDIDSNWSCPVSTLTQSSSQTSETLTPTSTSQFQGVVLERPNNISTAGMGVDKTGKRCKLCANSMQGLSGGIAKIQEEQEPSPQPQPPPGPENPTCANPRFFSGEARFCRSGGLTILGASCCGISGMFKSMCNNKEKELKKKRQAELCTYVGEFCSKRWKIGFIKICVEKKRSFCCFNSRLARILQECGRPQIGKGWGDAKNPDCSGYTIDEFARVDFTSESCVQAIEMWANQMAQSVGERVVQNIASQVNDRVQWWINSVKNTKDYGGEK
jgi:conjugal transfer mating pair stabilization protein TraN